LDLDCQGFQCTNSQGSPRSKKTIHWIIRKRERILS
jgi:hypothetical protein